MRKIKNCWNYIKEKRSLLLRSKILWWLGGRTGTGTGIILIPPGWTGWIGWPGWIGWTGLMNRFDGDGTGQQHAWMQIIRGANCWHCEFAWQLGKHPLGQFGINWRLNRLTTKILSLKFCSEIKFYNEIFTIFFNQSIKVTYKLIQTFLVLKTKFDKLVNKGILLASMNSLFLRSIFWIRWWQMSLRMDFTSLRIGFFCDSYIRWWQINSLLLTWITLIDPLTYYYILSRLDNNQTPDQLKSWKFW